MVLSLKHNQPKTSLKAHKSLPNVSASEHNYLLQGSGLFL